MTSREFFDIVSEMRRQQKEYFRTRQKENLEQSKMLERQVDEEIRRVENILNNKPTLFDETRQTND